MKNKKILKLTHKEITDLFRKCDCKNEDYIKLKHLWMTSELIYWLDCKQAYCKLAFKPNGKIKWLK